MLRITLQMLNETELLLKLEGKLLEPWLDEVQRSLHGSPSKLQLDLSS